MWIWVFSHITAFFLISVSAELDHHQQIQNVSVVEGRMAKLKCLVEDLEIYKAAWVYYGGTGSAVLAVGKNVLTSNKRIQVKSDSGLSVLMISNSSNVDEGYYMCQINTSPVTKKYSSLNVLVSPKIFDEPKDKIIMEGENATLQCRATGDPLPSITWKVEDPSDIFPKHSITYKGKNKSVLRLYNVTRHSPFAYLCVAANGVSPAVSARAQIFVECVPKIRGGRTAHVAASVGDSRKLRFDFHAFPQPEVIWAKIGDNYTENVSGYSKIEYRTLWEGTTTLWLKNIQESNFGVYQCKITNKMGTAMMYIYLIEMKNANDSERPEKAVKTSTTEVSVTINASSSDQNSSTKMDSQFTNNMSINNIIKRYLELRSESHEEKAPEDLVLTDTDEEGGYTGSTTIKPAYREETFLTMDPSNTFDSSINDYKDRSSENSKSQLHPLLLLQFIMIFTPGLFSFLIH